MPIPRVLVLGAGASGAVDLIQDDDDYYVLTTALRDFASRARDEVAYDHPSADSHTRWAQLAETALKRLEAASSARPTTNWPRS